MSHLEVSWPSFSLDCGGPWSTVILRCWKVGLEHLLGSKWGTPRIVIGNQIDTYAISIHSSAILLEQRIMCVLHVSGVQAFHSPPVSPTSPPIKWSHLLFLKPQRLGHPTCCSNHSLLREGLHQCNPFFFFAESPPRGTGPYMITSFPFIPDAMWMFFIPLFVQSFLLVSS